MNKKLLRLASIFLILIAIGTAAVFAFDNDDYNLAFKQGYQKGYTSYSKKEKAIRTLARHAANNAYSRNVADYEEKRQAFESGYKQGWDDKANGRDNRYF